jgi:hypothetical protein
VIGGRSKDEIFKNSVLIFDLKTKKSIEKKYSKECKGFKGMHLLCMKSNNKIKLFQDYDKEKDEKKKSFLISDINMIDRMMEKKKFIKLPNFANITSDIKNLITECEMYGDYSEEELIKFKDDYVKKIVKIEFTKFYEKPEEEVLMNTLFIKNANDILINFPLFKEIKKEEPSKGGFFSNLFGSKEQTKEPTVKDLVYVLPPIIIKFEKAFKTELRQEFENLTI